MTKPGFEEKRMKQMDKINKNEIVARFMGYTFLTDATDLTGYYTKSYDNLMPAWVRFRDLKFDQFQQPVLGYSERLWACEYAILRKSITEAFDELVKGIEWYESLKKNNYER